tara:strand:- start:149 stop:526 length:378 start_codon:yes stop_codon:yes gene_type:complete
MKKMIFAFAIGLLCCNISSAQESRKSFEFQVIKPRSVVKSTAGYLCDTSKKMFIASKDFWTAPFTTVGPALETNKFKMTLPKFEFKKGLFQHIPGPPDDEQMKDYLIPIIIDDGDGSNPTMISDF